MLTGTQARAGTENFSSKLKRSGGLAWEVEQEERNLTVYPNPASGSVNLSLSGFGRKRTNIYILNVIGTVVYQETLHNADSRFVKTIDVSRFANGLYYIKLQADDYSEIQKVVLK